MVIEILIIAINIAESIGFTPFIIRGIIKNITHTSVNIKANIDFTPLNPPTNIVIITNIAIKVINT